MVKQSPSNMCFLNHGLKKTFVVFKLNSLSVTSTEWEFQSIYHSSVAFHLMNQVQDQMFCFHEFCVMLQFDLGRM